MQTVLHVGCGGSPLPSWLASSKEVRLDIDPSCYPDIVASMTDLGEIGEFDTIYCSHALEHLTAPEAVVALKEFYRVVKPGGKVIVMVPDLEGIQPTLDVLYESESGPITGLDMIYGATRFADYAYMRHKTGFVKSTMEKALQAAGFEAGAVSRASFHNLIAVGEKRV